MKIINEQLLDETQAKALQSPRLRMNYNFHEKLDDPINRLLNAMEPGTYLRPHRHLNPAKDEIFLLLRGKVAGSARVRLDIVNAVSAYTGFGSDRIKVLGMERSD